jgi:DNA polymerase elongation subunit (family B)
MYKDEMKKSYKAGDTEKGEYYHLMQYTMKILLNSLYGATALNSFRYGMPLSILSEAITLSGWRIIQESALVANRHMNKILRNRNKIRNIMEIEYRPWGAYEVLHDTSEAKVKIIEVEPRSRLSYQYHTKRQEQWTVIYGELTIILR